ncbi:hypothetical protein EPN15_04965 [Patescibacteria group bacterium]|nr:MAG: hypothetical protein EPN15_04965 [Patescibacteria group bacterium]
MFKEQGKDKQTRKATASDLWWHFPSADHGEDDGFSDPLLEYFQGDHEKYVARETIQNAIDVRLEYQKPVSVVFERFSIPVSALPGQKEFLDKLNRCLAFIKGQEKAERFYKTAIDLAKSNELSVLRISDFNTLGLSGADDDVAGNWYRLVRATGTSSPKGAGGGTFGIGKGAPFAASALRTVFYSSVNDKGEAVFQGKARLLSHHDENRDIRKGVGFFGVKGYQAVRDADLIPDLFKRLDRGTDIFIIGYKSGEDWQKKLIKSILHNFWLAILHGDLEVTVRDGSEKTITKENLKECLEEYNAEDAKFFFEAVTNWTQKFEEPNLKHLGKVFLFVRKQENYPGKIMMARKPKMMVYEKRCRVLREPYAGVFICENDRGNALLSNLEPPAHDEWDRNRFANGWAAMHELEDFIKKSLKSMGETITSEPQDIPGLDRYLPDSEDRDYLSQQGPELIDQSESFGEEESGREVGAEKEPAEAEIETVIRKGVVTNKFSDTVKPAPPEGFGKGSRGRATGQEGGEKEGVRIKTSSISFRSFIQKSKGGFEYHFVITGRDDCDGAVRLVAVGDDGNYPVDIESATDIASGKNYDVGDSMIKDLSVKNGKSLKLAVRLASKKKYSLGIENYEG